MRRLCSVLVGVLCAAAGSLAVADSATQPDKAYTIKFDRPTKVGQKFRIDNRGAIEALTEISQGGQILGQEKEFLEFEVAGVQEILQQDDGGRTTRYRFTVDKCVKIVGGGRVHLADKGLVVIASDDDGGKKIEPADPKVALSEECVKVLKEGMPAFHQKGSPEMDEIFGTDKRRRVGDSWPANAEKLAKSLEYAPADKGAGMVKLTRVRKIDGKEFLEITIEVNLKDVIPHAGAGISLENAACRFVMEGTLAADPADDSTEEGRASMTSSYAAKVPGPDGKDRLVKVRLKCKLESSQHLIKKD